MIRIGLLGAGHLGKIHLRILQTLQSQFHVVGFFDPEPATAAHVAETYGVPAFESAEALIEAADALDIVTPTTTHFELTEKALKLSKHVFVEKPLASNPAEAKLLESLRKEAGVVGQVGHVERFNPALLAVKDIPMQPMFVEVHRLAQWNPRGTDVSVVLDLMIHDIDVALFLTKSPVKRVSASGVAVISDSPDIANARIEFHNGAVANLTASRISMKNMRKTRIFQPNMYISLDFLEKQVEMFTMADEAPEATLGLEFELPGRKRWLLPNAPEVQPSNAIELELKAFAEAIETRQEPPVSFFDGFLALDVAHQVMAKIAPNAA